MDAVIKWVYGRSLSLTLTREMHWSTGPALMLDARSTSWVLVPEESRNPESTFEAVDTSWTGRLASGKRVAAERAEDDGYCANGSRTLSVGGDRGRCLVPEISRILDSISPLKSVAMTPSLEWLSLGISSQSGKVHVS